MKKINKIIIVCLSIILLEVYIVPISAIEESTPKEEVIYANLSADGSVDEVYAVNIMDTQNGRFVDYGNYDKVKNLTSSNQLYYKNNKITAKTKEKKLYYQGYLKDTELPWKIKLSYTLDNQKISTKQLAGASGDLKITVEIKENQAVDSKFFKNFGLQITFLLDTQLCQGIKAERATVANVGTNKQLTYTILPGNESNFEITTRVKDFEMENISINGIRLNLGISLENFNTIKLDNKIKEIQNATSSLNKGVHDLNNGAGSLNTGANNLKKGISQIQNGLNQLDQQLPKIKNGSHEVKNALQTINQTLVNLSFNLEELEALTKNSSQINTGIKDLVKGLDNINLGINHYEQSVGGSIEDITTKSEAIITQLEQLKETDTNNTQLYQTTIELLKAGMASEKMLVNIQSQLQINNDSSLMAGAVSIQNSYQLFDQKIHELANSLTNIATNTNQLKSGISILLEQYNQIDLGLINYSEALKDLVAGYGQVYQGADNMVEGTNKMYQESTLLNQGTNRFNNETRNIDDSLEQILDEVIADNYIPSSYLSENNTNVEGVQFVLKIAGIKKPEVEVKEVKAKDKSIWDKILEFVGLA